jgi:transcriptional regulator GlxA family with amidase domain
MEQVLRQALVGCLAFPDRREPSTCESRHHTIMRRFRAVLEEDPTRALYVLEVATAVGVSLRSLSACCHEYLGMGPKRYLLLRRMNLARRALSAASATETTVTEVATQHGFWAFGRFAGEYKALFGELPSTTLHRPAIEHPDATRLLIPAYLGFAEFG